MGISDNMDDATIVIDETEILKIKATICLTRFFRNHRLTSNFCSVIRPGKNESLFSPKMIDA